MPSNVERLTKSQVKAPVVILERVCVRTYLKFIKRYKLKPLFIGRLAFPPILFWGKQTTEVYFRGTKYVTPIYSELLRVLTEAKLDETHIIYDWFEKKGRLMIQVMPFQQILLTKRAEESDPDRH